jgi:hypothetical protein
VRDQDNDLLFHLLLLPLPPLFLLWLYGPFNELIKFNLCFPHYSCPISSTLSLLSPLKQSVKICWVSEQVMFCVEVVLLYPTPLTLEDQCFSVLGGLALPCLKSPLYHQFFCRRFPLARESRLKAPDTRLSPRSICHICDLTTDCVAQASPRGGGARICRQSLT